MMPLRVWGDTAGGPAHILQIDDGGHCRAVLSDFGARIVALWCPDRQGMPGDIVLGHDTPAEYEIPASRYVGATCGRYANRIAGGAIVLDGAGVQLDRNEGQNHLHGGTGGFDAVIWAVSGAGPSEAAFGLVSPHGDMGYPGGLTAEVRYAFTAPGRLEITPGWRCVRSW